MKRVFALAAGLRDVVIFVFGATYFIGQFLLSYYSVRMGVGSVIGSDINFYVTGSMITAMLLAYIAVTYTLSEVSVGRSSVIYIYRCVVVSLLIMIVLFFVMLMGADVSRTFVYNCLDFLMFFFFLAALLATPHSVRAVVRAKLRLNPRIMRSMASLLVIFFLAFVVLLFVIPLFFYVLPRLPQELGGVKPRCAQLDIATGELSEQTKQYLGIDVSGAGVAATGKLAVLFNNSNYVVIRMSDEALQINQSTIRAIRWCSF